MAFSVVPLGAFISFSLASCPNAIMASWSLLGGLVYLLVHFTGSHALLFRQVTALLSAIIFPVLSMAH